MQAKAGILCLLPM